MPCSCGMTFCPCGIPCYCVAESCKCQDCAIALPRFCKLCNKPLISHRKTDEDTCSCFLREPSALILENGDIPMRRMGNIPMSINHLVTGKITVNFAIPTPTLTSPPLISQQPFCFMPPLSIEESQKKNLSTSYEDALKPQSPSEDSNSTTEIYEFPRKFSRQFSDYNSSGYSSNSEQNTEIPRQKIYTPPGILHSTRESQTVNVEQKTGTEICANIGEKTSFYLPSVIIDNISYPVRLEDPVWRLPNPATVVEPEPTLNIGNPFYAGGPINAIQNNEYNRSSTFEVDEIQCFPETEVENILEGVLPFQMNQHILDPTTISENLVTNEENIDITSPYNNAITSSYNSVVPYSSNAIAEQFATSTFPTVTAKFMNQIIERLCPLWISRSQENSLFPFRIRRNLVGQEATVKQTSNTLYLDPRTIEKMEKYLNL